MLISFKEENFPELIQQGQIVHYSREECQKPVRRKHFKDAFLNS